MVAKTDAERAKEWLAAMPVMATGEEDEQSLAAEFAAVRAEAMQCASCDGGPAVLCRDCAKAIRAEATKQANKTMLARFEAALRIALHDVATGGPMDQEGR